MGVYLWRAKVSKLDFAPPELVAFFCVACYKDLAPNGAVFQESARRESISASLLHTSHGL
jgi:hypothetical protein